MYKMFKHCKSDNTIQIAVMKFNFPLIYIWLYTVIYLVKHYDYEHSKQISSQLNLLNQNIIFHWHQYEI